jgi:hypothetical protein
MKSKLPLFLVAALGLAFFPSCSQVTVTEPFGTKPAELEPGDWNGVWRMDDGNRGRITVSKDQPGEFVFSEVPDPKDKPKEPGEESEDLTMAVREVDGDFFFTVIAEGDKKAGPEHEGGLTWGRIVRMDNTLVVWLPDVDAFAPLVKNGTVPGEDKRKKDEKSGSLSGSIVLGKLDEAQMNAIAKGTHGVLFGWDEPIVMVRDPWREKGEEKPAGGE